MPQVLALLFASQLVVQAAQLLTGLLIVRNLSISQYAIYTLFSLGVGLLGLVSDPGTTQVLVSVATKYSDDRPRVEALVRNVLKYGSVLLVVGAIPVIAYVLSALFSYAVGIAKSAFFATVLFGHAMLAFLERVYVARRNIYRELANFARTGFYSNSIRLVYVALILSIAPNWECAILSLPVGSIVTLLILKLKSNKAKLVDWTQERSEVAAKDVRRVAELVIPLLPGTIYAVVAGQLPLLLSIGVADPVAIGEYGGLSRLGQIVGVVGVLNSNVLNAYLASQANDPVRFIRRLLLVLGAYAGYTALALVSASFWPALWFGIIGQQYMYQQALLFPVILSAGFGLVGAALYFATISLERTKTQWLHIVGGLSIVGLFGMFKGFAVSTASEMVWLTFALLAGGVLVQGTIVVLAIVDRYQMKGRV